MRDLTFDIKGRDKTQAAFDSARRNARAFNSDVDRTGAGMRVAAAAAKAFAAAFTITAVANFGRVVRETVGEASALAKMADKVGVTTDEIQQMTFGFGQAGVAASDIERNLEQFSKRISEANFYGGRLADIFAANGVSLTDQNGKLRSSTELLRELADLIKNASSDQERMTLAVESFGRSGGDMVLALRNGADGMDELMRRTEAAGGVIDEELLRKAEELDDEFDAMWRRFEINSKTAILGAVNYLDQLRSGAEALGNSGIFKSISEGMAGLGLMSDDLTYLDPDLARAAGQPLGPDARIRDAFGGAMTPRNAELEAELARRFGGNALAGAPATIIPKKDDEEKRKKSASAADAQAKAYERVMEALDHERQMIGLTDTAQRVMNEQRRAGVEATSAQGQAIEQLVVAIEAELDRMDALQDRQQALNDAMSYLGSTGLDAFFAWAEGAATAEDALKSMIKEVVRALAYGALLGQGPFGRLLGGSGGGGLLGTLLGGLFGGVRAEGGPTDPYREYLVGEQGPEILRMGGRGGEIISNKNAFGGEPAAVQEIRISGVFVDDDGVIKGMITSAEQRATQSGAALGAKQIADNMPGLLANSQTRDF